MSPASIRWIAVLALAAPPTARAATPLRFADVAAERGLAFTHDFGGPPLANLAETTGSGACVLDFDGDGDDDVFLVNGGSRDGGPRPPNRLFRNDGGRFADATAGSGAEGRGFGMGCAAADVEGDGDVDLLVTNVGPDELLLNDGRGRFRDVSAQAGLAHAGWSTGAAFADHDRDGDLDLYVGGYVDLAAGAPLCPGPRGMRILCRPFDYPGTPGRLWRNDGPGPDGVPRFADVTTSAGAVEPVGRTLGVLFEDLTDDGWPDLYLANDTVRNTLLVNRGDGTFVDRTLLAGVGFLDTGVAAAGMGAECGDLDGDGLADLVVTNFQAEPNSVYRGLGAARWIDATASSGVAAATLAFLGFGVNAADFDLDGDLDLLFVNGHVDDQVAGWDPGATYRQRHQLFENRTGRGRLAFADVSAGALPGAGRVGRGSALLDFDSDGDLDVVVNDSGGQAELLENRTPRAGASWLGVRLEGTAPNTRAVGARVRVRTSAGAQWRRVRTASSYLSCSSATLHFGLGPAASAEVVVEWPDGRASAPVALGCGRVHVLRPPAGGTPPPAEAPPPAATPKPPPPERDPDTTGPARRAPVLPGSKP